MELRYNLLLSPHPDDLVFSGFSALCEHSEKRAIVFFNVSRYTRWKVKSKLLVSGYRTLEDRIILGLFGVRVSFLFLEDTSLCNERPQSVNLTELKAMLPSRILPRKIFCPLGIGGHSNHLLVRQSGIDLWHSWEKKPELFFYEDLPYATFDLRNSRYSLEGCLDDVKRFCGTLRIAWRPISASEMRQKLLAGRAYASQTNHTKLLAEHSRKLGKECSAEFAEKYFAPE